MVKGINRQVIVVKAPETALFEQAIFLLREDALEKNGIGEKDLMEEAQRIAESYIHRRALKKSGGISPLGYMLLGALPIGLGWLLMLLL